ncbi:uncharacterized protein [Spinacia oleracea]|uniref:Uncharacterized protein n=1 Tax=Spinacia oleracea TaxID=3562 RepID=A0A9R0JMC5_SPIOL|nr:uncharacterized protein LOC110779397 [Spinacia oleracea]
MSLEEKEGGVPRSERLMDAFRTTMDDCGMKDLGFMGSIFMWKRGTSIRTFKRERLDRFMADNEWCNSFSYYNVRHYPIYRSDHAPILLIASNYYELGDYDMLFKFEAMWLSSEECGKVVEEAWAGCVGQQTTQLGMAMGRVWLDDLHRLEESYWHARARANEMKDGDKNTSYFHRKASNKKHVNGIKGLFDEAGVWKVGKGDLEGIVTDYFQNLFTTENASGFLQALEGIERVVLTEMNTE